MTPRDALHKLVDELPESDVEMVERMLRALAAPLDDEPDNDDADGGLTEAREQADRGELIPHEEVKRRLGS